MFRTTRSRELLFGGTRYAYGSWSPRRLSHRERRWLRPGFVRTGGCKSSRRYQIILQAIYGIHTKYMWLFVLMSRAYVFVLSLHAARELGHLSPIARHFKTGVDELSPRAQAGNTSARELPPIAQALKTCADELPPIAQAGGNMCRYCRFYCAIWAR